MSNHAPTGDQPANRQHALFRRFPIMGQRRITTGTVPVPYHIYKGHMIFIGGTARLAAVRNLIAAEHVTPYQTTDGCALAGFWVADFTDASLGPHRELQFSIFVAHEPQPPVAPHPFAILKLLALDPAARMLCHGLWNDSAAVVAFNRELLGLNGRRCEASLSRHRGRRTFSFNDDRSGQAILSGTVQETTRTPLSALVSLGWQFGPRGLLAFARQSTVAVTVVNTISDRLPHNADAQTFTSSRGFALRRFDPANDHLTLEYRPYTALDFTPQVVEQMSGVRFVYLSPEEALSEAAS